MHTSMSVLNVVIGLDVR